MTKQSKAYAKAVATAHQVYDARQIWWNWDSAPSGRRDNGGRWFPSPGEHRPCCDTIRRPSRAFPYTLLAHCRTARHIAQLYGVSRSEVLTGIVKSGSR